MTASAAVIGYQMNISAALSEISSYGEFFTITVGGTDTGWQPVRRFYDNGCAELINATVARFDTADLRIGASMVQFSHASRLWSPVLACALGHGVVPDLTHLERADDAARLRLPDPTGEPVDRDDPPPDLLYRIVVQQHLEPLAAGLRVKMASGLLFGNAASALVGASRALQSARPDLCKPATRLTESLLATGKLANAGMIGPNLVFRRRSCCLYYRAPTGSKCSDCALT
jgi:FhuF 2Fe-2S C-terminal domain